MITILIHVLILILLLLLIHYVCAMFIAGRPLQIIDVILALIGLLYLLRLFGVLGSVAF